MAESGKYVIWSWRDYGAPECFGGPVIGPQCRLASVSVFESNEHAQRWVAGAPELAVYPLEYDPPLAIEQSKVVIRQLRAAVMKGMVRDDEGEKPDGAAGGKAQPDQGPGDAGGVAGHSDDGAG